MQELLQDYQQLGLAGASIQRSTMALLSLCRLGTDVDIHLQVVEKRDQSPQGAGAKEQPKEIVLHSWCEREQKGLDGIQMQVSAPPCSSGWQKLRAFCNGRTRWRLKGKNMRGKSTKAGLR